MKRRFRCQDCETTVHSFFPRPVENPALCLSCSLLREIGPPHRDELAALMLGSEALEAWQRNRRER